MTDRTEVIADEYEAAVARYWDTKQDDPINLLLGADDGLIHHHYGVGDFDRAVLDLPQPSRESAVLREMHRLENRQVELILDALSPVGAAERLLDAGCGRGGTAFMLHDRFGCPVDGVTISRYQVEFATGLAQQRGCADSVRFHLRNMLRTGFASASFDGVVTNETTMYVDVLELCREFGRVLRPGGRYALITWCLNDRTGPTAETERIDRHYGTRMHRRSAYFAALAATGFVPYRVVDLTTDAIPYWELRSQSRHRTGIETAFLDSYRQRTLNFTLIATELVG